MIENTNHVATLRPAHTADGIVLRGTLLATSMLTVMAGATIAPALPTMQAVFADVDNVAFWVRLVLTLPALFIVIGAPITGYIVDTLGRKRLLVVAAVVYGLAGGSGLFADSLTTLLIGRAFLGLAVAGVMTSVTTLIADYYIGNRRAQFLGLQAAFMGFGGTLFLSLGGLLADVSWRAPFLIYLVSFLVLPFIITRLYEPQCDLPEDPIPEPLYDPGDCVAEARRYAQEQPARHAAPPERAPLRLMAVIYPTVVMMHIIFYLVPVQLPFYLQTLTSATATQSGLIVGEMALFFALAAALFGWFDARFHRITVIILAFALTGIGYQLVSLAEGWPLIMLGLPIGGFGIGLLMPNLNVWLANQTPAALRGRALGGFTTAVFLGQFLSPIVSQPLIDGVGIATTYGLVGELLLLLSLLVFIMRFRQGRRREA
ncbi:MAG: MFS transporter [Chloroflexaceae bacterium]